MISNPKYRFVDIAANLTSGFYAGIYKGHKYHDPDLDEVFKRAHDVGCDRLLVSASYLDDSKHCLKIAKMNDKYYCTVGVHPTRTHEIEKNGGLEAYRSGLEKIITDAGDKCVAIGECGLDYDRF
jgi:TatD DNase family protein